MTQGKRAALYLRVSTDAQSIENQRRELRQIAERRGWQVVEEYHDAGISGTKGRDLRPGLDRMLNDAKRRRFEWSWHGHRSPGEVADRPARHHPGA